MSLRPTLKKQTGFTLVEIAIVLVIVGLLLGAVLKGQELIFNSKVKSTFTMSKEIAAATYSYQDRYKKVPGDDNGVVARFPTATPIPINGSGNGYIDWGPFPCAANSGGENCQTFYHLRLAGFISGNGAESPLTPFGGRVAMGAGQVFYPGGSGAPTFGLEGTGLNHKIMSMMDNNFDDGNPTTGSIRCRNLAAYNMSTPESILPDWCSIPL